MGPLFKTQTNAIQQLADLIQSISIRPVTNRQFQYGK